MATKKNPGAYDCYHKALDDEPMFTLLARDRLAPYLVERWADVSEDRKKAEEARLCAASMRLWREGHVKGERETSTHDHWPYHLHAHNSLPGKDFEWSGARETDLAIEFSRPTESESYVSTCVVTRDWNAYLLLIPTMKPWVSVSGEPDE